MTGQEKAYAEANRRIDEIRAELDKTLLYRWIDGKIGLRIIEDSEWGAE